jgi:hypothetical protein
MTGLVRVLSCSVGGGLALLITFTPTQLGPDRTGEGDVGGPGAACIDRLSCIDGYLWSIYQRTPKVEMSGEDFTWKDADAAGKAGMSPRQYAIGGMDRGFRITLYRALRALDLAGFQPGIMCGFRDDYRQRIATGKMKARDDRSYHGGSFRGGYGHGMAADIVSLNGRTRDERSAATDRMWNYIDSHEKQLGIGRPYLNRDPPHVAPIDGEEYAAHRLFPNAQGAFSKGAISKTAVPKTAVSKAPRRPPLAVPADPRTPRREAQGAGDPVRDITRSSD